MPPVPIRAHLRERTNVCAACGLAEVSAWSLPNLFLHTGHTDHRLPLTHGRQWASAYTSSSALSDEILRARPPWWLLRSQLQSCLFGTVASFRHAQVCTQGCLGEQVLWRHLCSEVSHAGWTAAYRSHQGCSWEPHGRVWGERWQPRIPRKTWEGTGYPVVMANARHGLYLGTKERDKFEGLEDGGRGYQASCIKLWAICLGFPSVAAHGLVGSAEMGSSAGINLTPWFWVPCRKLQRATLADLSGERGWGLEPKDKAPKDKAHANHCHCWLGLHGWQ